MLALLFAAAAATATPQHYKFDEDQVEGDVVRPESDVVSSAPMARHTSLVRVRLHFLDELVQSADR